MEKTPSYFITKEAPQRVHHMNPGTKYDTGAFFGNYVFNNFSIILFEPFSIITFDYVTFRLLVVVRDPVTRAISDYTQAASKRKEMKAFEELAFLNRTTGW